MFRIWKYIQKTNILNPSVVTIVQEKFLKNSYVNNTFVLDPTLVYNNSVVSM